MSHLLKHVFAVIVVLTQSAVAADLRSVGDVVPVTGAPFRAQLTSIAADGMATWKPEQGEPRKLPLIDLCWWGSFAEAPTQTQIVLVDRSLIVADVISIDKQQLKVDWNLGGELKLPLEWVAGILISPPVDRQQADLLRFQHLSSDSRAQSDRLILLNGDELSGEIVGLADSTVKIRTAAGETSVSKEKIAAIAFDPSLAAKPNTKQPRYWMGLTDGSRLVASALTVDEGQARITTAAVPQLKVSAAKVIALQPLTGRAVYLSDLKPADYQHIPFLDLKWPYHTDRNVLGSQLRAGGRLYLKGFGMHTSARLTYDLPSPSPAARRERVEATGEGRGEGEPEKLGMTRSARIFAAEIAIDDQTNGQGSAVFRVYTDDGSGNWQLKYESSIVRGGATPLPISVEMAGAKRLRLQVDVADHGDIQGHADWLNARLLP
jgi:NPCBM/NEW2 domain